MTITMTFILSLVEHSNSNLVAYFIDLINHIYPYINVCIANKVQCPRRNCLLILGWYWHLEVTVEMKKAVKSDEINLTLNGFYLHA